MIVQPFFGLSLLVRNPHFENSPLMQSDKSTGEFHV